MDLNKALVVEDDSAMASSISEVLSLLGLRVEYCSDGEKGLDTAIKGEFSLVVLDVKLPLLGGMEICRRLRAVKPLQPVLMVTGEADEVSKVLGLELGADDYITKPFSAKELQARASALLRRYRNAGVLADSLAQSSQITKSNPEELEQVSGNLTVDPVKQVVLVDGKRVQVTISEYRLLWVLVCNRGRTISAEELANLALGYCGVDDYVSSVRPHLSRLRKKLSQAGISHECIVSEHGFGYRFEDPSN